VAKIFKWRNEYSLLNLLELIGGGGGSRTP